MVTRPSMRRIALTATAAALALSSFGGGAAAHLGDSGHIHAPGDSTVPSSSVWCVQFTQDPGVWRPDGVTAVDASLLEGVSIVFVDCDELLSGYYTIESFAGGSLERTEVNEPVIGMPDGSSTDTATDDTPAVNILTAAGWGKHQKQYLAKGDRLAARMVRAKTVRQARQALGAMQKHLKSESDWLRANKERFEPGSCVSTDKNLWKKHVDQARKSLNKAVSAINKENLAAANTNMRQFLRSWTKLEQVYNAAVCDF
jgi:hypothetical protein